MNEGNVFFLRASEFCGRPVLCCTETDRVSDVALRMSERRVSSVVVCHEGIPKGVVTDRDFRNKLVPFGLDAREVSVAQVMTSPVVTVRLDDLLFEIIDRMSRHHIHRVVVVDAAGFVQGVVTDSDVLRLQSDTPHHLIRDVGYAGSVNELRDVAHRVTELVIRYGRAGVRTLDLMRLISHVNDAVVQRLVTLLIAQEGNALPGPAAFLALGSEGRGEQTLKTDQDNALVFADGLSGAQEEILRRFSVRVVDALVSIGVPRCPGGVMASEEPWRKSVGGWGAALAEWTATPSPENILRFSMFSDLRTVHGEAFLENALRERILKEVGEHSFFLAHLAKNVLRFPSPLGWLGRLKTENSGDRRGLIDIKKGGIFPLTEGVRVLALSSCIGVSGTVEKLRALEASGVLSRKEADEFESAFVFFCSLRLRSQVEDVARGRPPSNLIDTAVLTSVELSRLKLGFSAVKSFREILGNRFRLHFVAD